MKHRAFHWERVKHQADDFHVSGRGMSVYLHAWSTGEWKVIRRASNEVLVSHADQRRGADLGEAKRMAQAAAMIQLSFIIKPQSNV